MEYEEATKRTARILVIILLAMAFMTVAVSVVGLALGPINPDGAEDVQMVLWVVLALPLLELPAIALIWNTQSKQLEEADDWETRLGLVRARTVLIGAMLEGPALFAGVSFVLAGPNWQALPALVLFCAGLGVLLPRKHVMMQTVGRADGSKPDEYS